MVFLGVGLAINAALGTLWSAGNVIWVDFIHVNPYRTTAHAVLLLVLSPLYGAALSLALSWLAVASAAALATITAFALGRVPPWSLPVIALVSVAPLVWQESWPVADGPPWRLLLGFVTGAGILMPSLVGSWAALRWVLR